MKKLLLVAILFSISCQKETPTQEAENERKIRHLSITNICFDGVNYHVDYEVKGLRVGDELYGGCSNDTDILSKVQLTAKDGAGSFIAQTNDCSVKVYLMVIKTDGKAKWLKKDGNCEICK